MNYFEALTRAIEGWNENPIKDEWLFEKFRDEFVKTMSPGEAFDAINKTVDILLQHSDESTVVEIMQTIIALARQSETTEIPPELFKHRSILVDHFANYGGYAKNKLHELFQYYRF